MKIYFLKDGKIRYDLMPTIGLYSESDDDYTSLLVYGIYYYVHSITIPDYLYHTFSDINGWFIDMELK